MANFLAERIPSDRAMSDPFFCALPHPATLEIDSLLAQCDLRAVRGSGPGGQHRNKVSTGIVVTHRDTRITGEATERRSQSQNRQVAIHRLRIRLAIRLRTKQADVTTGSSLATFAESYGGVRLRIAESNLHYASLLAALLDRIFQQQGDLTAAASDLLTTSSQIVRLLRAQPEALKIVNGWRSDASHHPLR